MICVCWTAKMIQVERRLTAKQNKATSDTEEEGTRRDESSSCRGEGSRHPQ